MWIINSINDHDFCRWIGCENFKGRYLKECGTRNPFTAAFDKFSNCPKNYIQYYTLQNGRGDFIMSFWACEDCRRHICGVFFCELMERFGAYNVGKVRYTQRRYAIHAQKFRETRVVLLLFSLLSHVGHSSTSFGWFSNWYFISNSILWVYV